MVVYKMKTETIVMCVIALILGMLMANMLKSVCGCKVVEGQGHVCCTDRNTNCGTRGSGQVISGPTDLRSCNNDGGHWMQTNYNPGHLGRTEHGLIRGDGY